MDNDNHAPTVSSRKRSRSASLRSTSSDSERECSSNNESESSSDATSNSAPGAGADPPGAGCNDRRESGEAAPPTASRSRKRKRRKRASSVESRLYQSFDLLSQQLVSHINNVMSTNCNYIMSKISSKTPDVLPMTPKEPPPAPVDDLRPPQIPTPLESIADLNVVIKEPAISKANPDRVAKITAMQRFESPDWNAVRYTDIQKKYVAYPCFTELRVNEELRRLEDPFAPLRWFQMERSFAALSNAFLAQNESVNSALQKLIDWSASADVQLSPTNIYEKMKELFGNESSYKTVSHDIFQIICGKRAEVLELRRRSLLKCLKNKYTREDIDKIPPSNEYMFNPEALGNYIQKIGGIDKLQKQTNAPQAPRSKSPEPSTSFQNKPFRPRPNKPKQTERKDSTTRRNSDLSAKKKGGRKEMGGRRSGNRHK